jgi:hypothetical protein
MVSFTPRPLYPRESVPGTHWTGGRVDPRAGLDDLEKRKFLTLPGLEFRPLGHSARNQSLYRLRYPESLTFREYLLKFPIFLQFLYNPFLGGAFGKRRAVFRLTSLLGSGVDVRITVKSVAVTITIWSEKMMVIRSFLDFLFTILDGIWRNGPQWVGLLLYPNVAYACNKGTIKWKVASKYILNIHHRGKKPPKRRK